MMMMMMMMCFTGSKYSDTEELRKKNGRSILIYGSYLGSCILMCIMAKHHCVTLGICPALCYSEIKIYIYKYMKMRKKIWTLFKSLLQLCAQSVCTADTTIITRQAADEGSEDPPGVSPSTSYLCTVQEVLPVNNISRLFRTPQPRGKTCIQSWCHETHTHPSVCVSKNVASFHSAMLYNSAPCGASVKVPVIFKRRHI